jgi:hypothetical protein
MAGSSVDQTAGNAGVRPAALGMQTLPACENPIQPNGVHHQDRGGRKQTAPSPGRSLASPGGKLTPQTGADSRRAHGRSARRGGARAPGVLHLIQENKSADEFPVHADLNRRLIDTLSKIGKTLDADRCDSCGKMFRGYVCENGHKWAKSVSACQHKLCSFCMRARRARLLGKLGSRFDSFQRPKYVVLSRRNCLQGDLRETITALFHAFERLRHRKIWKQVRGCVVSVEVTYNRESETWHPHLNVLFDGPYIPQRDFLAAWNELNAGEAEAGVFIKAATHETLHELFKYVTKVSDFVDEPEAVRAFLNDTRRLKFVRCYGFLYDLDEEEKTEGCSCPDCGSTSVKFIGYYTAEQLWFDWKDVLRFHGSEGDSPPVRQPLAHEGVADFALAAVEVSADTTRELDFPGTLPEMRLQHPSLFEAAASCPF